MNGLCPSISWYHRTLKWSCLNVTPRSIADERAMPKCRAISEMTKIHYEPSQVYTLIKSSQKSINIDLKSMLQCSHIKENPIISKRMTMPQKSNINLKRSMPLCRVHQMKSPIQVSDSNTKRSLITSNKCIWFIIHHRLREICPCIRLTISNHPTISQAQI